MLLVFTLAIGLSVILILVNSSIAKKSLAEREKPSPFECGFDPKETSRIPFSLRFYLIALIFLIFDVEITLILPIPLISISFSSYSLVVASLFFLLILFLGTIHEWNEGALDWDL